MLSRTCFCKRFFLQPKHQAGCSQTLPILSTKRFYKCHCCQCLHSNLSERQTADKHHGAFIVTAGDFNHVSLTTTLPTFYQFVKCTTTEHKTLDLLYSNVKNASTAKTPNALPPLGRSDDYWVLSTDCDALYNLKSGNIHGFTDCITDFISCQYWQQDPNERNLLPTRQQALAPKGRQGWATMHSKGTEADSKEELSLL